MKKSDLTARLAEQHPELTPEDVKELIELIFETMAENLANGNRVELRNFGVFTPREHKARLARNPKTGELVPVLKKVAIHYKTGKELNDRINAAPSQPSAPSVQ